jgi:ATP-dependent Lon protease
MTVESSILPLLPLPNGVLFPDMVVTVVPESDQARSALAGPATEVVAVPVRDGIYAKVGVVARIEQRAENRGRATVVLRALRRVTIGGGALGPSGALDVTVDEVSEPPASDEAQQLAARYRQVAGELLEAIGGRRFGAVLAELATPGALADSIGWWPDLDDARRLELLETVDPTERITKALAWAEHALAELEVSARIAAEVRNDLDRTQREVILRRQLEAIRKELGESSGQDSTEYRERLGAERIPEAVRAAALKELDRLERMGDQSMEAGWIRTWLDTVLELPWGERTPDSIELPAARRQLDTDHTGLDKVKERIVEFLAVRKLRADRGVAPSRRAGTILALVGPPGVGKTSLGESIAAALGRRYVRMALGGVHDEAEIRGHRRTYVGARPGRIVRSLIEAGTMNPVIVLDEVDKLGADWRGDPAAALLEVLDPEQNHTFRDHYLETELDLSDVFFLATANQLDRIPSPLLDRMEVITLDGYSEDEKLAIALQHLLPRLLERNGVADGEIDLSDDVIRAVIADYTSEAGVRRLEQRLDRLVRRAVTHLVDDADALPVVIEHGDLRPALGRPVHREELADRTATPGVATGLAVTGAGGDVLFVEAAAMDGEPGLTLTGQLGDVMKESGQIALSYLRANRAALGIDDDLDRRFHVHFPAGAVPKDGPSAGIAMTTAVVSLLTGRPVRAEVAMTGEVTLHGRVLPIGGVKEKVLAAHRRGVREVILPAANGDDLADLPDDVRDAVTVHLVGTVPEVLTLALTAAPDARSSPTR